MPWDEELRSNAFITFVQSTETTKVFFSGSVQFLTDQLKIIRQKELHISKDISLAQ